MRRTLPAATAALCLLLAAPAAAATASPPAAPPSGTRSSPAAPSAASPPAVPADLTATEVSFRGDGGRTMHGTVLAPAAPAPARPGLVLVHGAGDATPRTKLMGEAVAFAREGVAVLVYDKRSEGYSRFRRSYAQLAGDALGAVAALRARPGVDPAKVGLWGLSEGGWVAPLAASRSRDVAFVVIVGANGMTPLRQQAWAVTSGLRRAGVSGSVVDRTEPTLYRAIADGGLFPEPHHDPGPVLAGVDQPVLAVWGTHDLLTPPRENPPLIAGALEKGGNRNYTFRFFPGADHAAHQTPDGGVTRLPGLTPGYAELVGSWIGEVTAGRPPTAQVSGPEPVQIAQSTPVDPPAWWESAPVQVAALALFLVAFTAYPVTALVRRLRGRSRAPVSRAAGLLSAGGLTVVLGGFSYLFHLTLTSVKLAAPGPLLAGRPLPWLALQLLAAACVIATARTALAWRRAPGPTPRGERVRLGLLLTGGAVFLPWAVYWGLLLP